MKTNLNRSSLLAGVVLALLSSSALAQSASASATTSATIVRTDIRVAKMQDMNLGQIVRPTSGTYTVSLASGGGRSGSGGSGGALVGGAGQTATFDVTGEADRTFTITTPATITLITDGGGPGKEVTFTPSHAATDNTGGASGSGDHTKQIEVTGTLAVPSTVAPGAYVSSLQVDVDYQ